MSTKIKTPIRKPVNNSDRYAWQLTIHGWARPWVDRNLGGPGFMGQAIDAMPEYTEGATYVLWMWLRSLLGQVLFMKAEQYLRTPKPSCGHIKPGQASYALLSQMGQRARRSGIALGTMYCRDCFEPVMDAERHTFGVCDLCGEVPVNLIGAEHTLTPVYYAHFDLICVGDGCDECHDALWQDDQSREFTPTTNFASELELRAMGAKGDTREELIADLDRKWEKKKAKTAKKSGEHEPDDR